MNAQNAPRYRVSLDALPHNFPTHKHDGAFWEALGRAVATFGFLEEVLAKAIFALTATRIYREDELQDAYAKWLPTLKSALSDPLGGQIATIEKLAKANPDEALAQLGTLAPDLRNVSKIRNVLCHGSWQLPDSGAGSVPFFVNSQAERFVTPVDLEFLAQTQRHVAELACEVVNTVMQQGWQFPGWFSGPGKVIWGGGSPSRK